MPTTGPPSPETPAPDSQLEFTRLFVGTQAAFHGYLFSLVHDHHAADDLVQDLAARLWDKFNGYDRARPFVSWGLGFARLLAFEWRRRQARLPVPLDDATLNALAEVAANRAEDHDNRRAPLRGCLRHLPDHQRRALHSRYYDDQSVAEIARLWRRTEMAVYKVLKRAHEILLDCMRKTMAAAEP